MMTVDDWQKQAQSSLLQAGIATARLDSIVLLEDVTSKSRSWLLAHPEFHLTTVQLKTLRNKINRRLQYEPLSYIRNIVEFYGRNYYIDHRVLEPRPETETMISNFLKLPTDSSHIIADIGTGSGAIAITLKRERPNYSVIASDIDTGCLVVARKNARHLKAAITFLKGDLLRPYVNLPQLKSRKQSLIILANLPYVPDNFHINESARSEPKLAIFGGSDGLEYYQKLFHQIQIFGLEPAYVLTEAMPPQHKKLREIADTNGYNCFVEDDFIQVFRPKFSR